MNRIDRFFDRINATVERIKAAYLRIPKPIRFILHPPLVFIGVVVCVALYVVLWPIVTLLAAYADFDK